MTPEKIKQLVLSGEGFNAEFKVSVPSKAKIFQRRSVAFANAAGGTVLIGVDDFNIIQGVTIDNARRSAIQNSIRNISPALNCSLEVVEC